MGVGANVGVGDGLGVLVGVIIGVGVGDSVTVGVEVGAGVVDSTGEAVGAIELEFCGLETSFI